MIAAVLTAAMLTIPSPPKNLSMTYRAVGMNNMSLQFSWQPPDTLSGYTYAVRIIVGDSVYKKTTSSKSWTTTVPRINSLLSIRVCVSSILAGLKSVEVCKAYQNARVDSSVVGILRSLNSPTITMHADTVMTTDSTKPYTRYFCIFAWIRGKVIQDPDVQWSSTNKTATFTIMGTDYATSCLGFIPPDKVWKLP